MRDSITKICLALPSFRGKNRIGFPLIQWTTDYQNEKDCIVTVRMRDGSQMYIDLRSRCERKVFFTEEYDDGIIQTLSQILEPGFTIFNVGANLGFYPIAWGWQSTPVLLDHLGILR